MWRCSKCGREFENNDQSHFCGKIETIDQYIAAQAEAVQPILKNIRGTIQSAAPEAEERISWNMPTFWQSQNLIHFAAFKKHIGIYPGDLTNFPAEERLEGYHRTKGAIQFPLNKPIDYDLIAYITQWRVSCAGQKTELKNGAVKKPLNTKIYEYEAAIQSAGTEDINKGGAYVVFPYDIRAEFGRGC